MPTDKPSAAIYPRSGRCANCCRERDDLFWHEEDQVLYCADTFRCEARYAIQASSPLRWSLPRRDLSKSGVSA